MLSATVGPNIIVYYDIDYYTNHSMLSATVGPYIIVYYDVDY